MKKNPQDWESLTIMFARLLEPFSTAVALTEEQLSVLSTAMKMNHADILSIFAQANGVCSHHYQFKNDPVTITFSRYGKALKPVSLRSLIDDSGAVARVENSGSEGRCVEVIKWSEARHRWERYAFNKLFMFNQAEVVVDMINANSRHAKIFHKFESAP